MLPRVSREKEIAMHLHLHQKKWKFSPQFRTSLQISARAPVVSAFFSRDAPNDSVKYHILTKPWTPHSYSFPNLTPRNLMFQLKWMYRFPFLSYREVQGGGALCRYCVFFVQGEVGKAQLVKLESWSPNRSVTEKCHRIV
jgi:hypothetical protein